MQAVPRFQLAKGRVTRLDGALNPQTTRRVRRSRSWKLLAATDDLAKLIAVDGDRVLLVGDDVRVLDITHADSATFLGPGRVLISAPVMGTTTWQGRTYDSRGEHRLRLFDTRSGEGLDEVVLDVCDAGVSALPHPIDGSIVLDAGEGQDGSHVFVAQIVSDRIEATRAYENTVAAAFGPSGKRLLLTPHPSFDGQAAVVDWATRERLHTLTAEAAGLDDHLDLYGCYLNDSAVLLKTYERGLLLTDGDLVPVARVQLGDDPSLDFELESLCALGPNTFATVTWRDRAGVTDVWTLELA